MSEKKKNKGTQGGQEQGRIKGESYIGESKGDVDIIRKGGEITPKPPKESNQGKNAKKEK